MFGRVLITPLKPAFGSRYSRMDQEKFVEVSLYKILLGLFFNTSTQMQMLMQMLFYANTRLFYKEHFYKQR